MEQDDSDYPRAIAHFRARLCPHSVGLLLLDYRSFLGEKDPYLNTNLFRVVAHLSPYASKDICKLCSFSGYDHCDHPLHPDAISGLHEYVMEAL